MSKFRCVNKDCNNRCEVELNLINKDPERCLMTGNNQEWEKVVDFKPEPVKKTEPLPKLTVDVFNRPDCPKWAKYAAVGSDGRCFVCREYPVKIGGTRWANPESYWEKYIYGQFDTSDWSNSLIKRPEKKELRHTPDFLPIRFKKLTTDAKAPYQATPGSAGFDLTAVSVKKHKESFLRRLVEYGTGLAVEIPAGHVGLVFPRSSIYKKQMVLTNGVGVIDSDYRGEIKAVFAYGEEIYNPGDRIAQLVIMPIPAVKFVEAEELTETERGAGGYGSTGK